MQPKVYEMNTIQSVLIYRIVVKHLYESRKYEISIVGIACASLNKLSGTFISDGSCVFGVKVYNQTFFRQNSSEFTS